MLIMDFVGFDGRALFALTVLLELKRFEFHYIL